MNSGKMPPPPGEIDPLEDVMRAALLARGQTLPMATPTMDSEGSALAEALAAPAGPEQYVVDVPRGIERDGGFESKARRWFHTAGLPQGLVRGILQEYCRSLTAAPETIPDERETLAELARDWGDDCARKVDLARSVIARSGDAAEIEEVLAASGLGNNAWLIRSLAALAEMPRPDSAALPHAIQGSQP